MGERARFCPNCGRPVEPGAMFCAHCGHKTEQPKRHRLYMKAPDANEEFATEWPDEQEERVQKNEPKGSKNLVIILGIVCAVMAVVIIATRCIWTWKVPKKRQNQRQKRKQRTEKGPGKKEVKDSNERNDSINQAITLEEGKPVTGYIDSKDDVDYFVISTQKEGTAEVKFSYTPCQ